MTSTSDPDKARNDWMLLYDAIPEHERPCALRTMQLAVDGDAFVNALLMRLLKTRSWNVRQRLFRYVDHVMARERESG